MKTFFVIIGALFACIIFNSCGSEDVFPEKMQMDGMSEFESNSEEVVNSEVALKEQLVDVLPKIMTLTESPTTRGLRVISTRSKSNKNWLLYQLRLLIC